MRCGQRSVLCWSVACRALSKPVSAPPPPPQGVRVYRNKESAKLMRYVDEQRAAAQRAAAEQQRAALGRAPARHEPPPQRAAPRPKR